MPFLNRGFSAKASMSRWRPRHDRKAGAVWRISAVIRPGLRFARSGVPCRKGGVLRDAYKVDFSTRLSGPFHRLLSRSPGTLITIAAQREAVLPSPAALIRSSQRPQIARHGKAVRTPVVASLSERGIRPPLRMPVAGLLSSAPGHVVIKTSKDEWLTDARNQFSGAVQNGPGCG